MISKETNRNRQKENWLETVITHELELTTNQIANALDVTPRTILGWRQKAEQHKIPTGVYEKGWIFPPSHLIELLQFVAKTIRPQTYKWVYKCKTKN